MPRKVRAVPALGGGGSGGSGGGGATLPPVPTAQGIYAIERESDGGPLAWVPLGGFTASMTGVAATVEVGTSIASVSGSIVCNAEPTSILITWSGIASGSQVVTPTGATTTFTITPSVAFTSATNGGQLTVTASVVFSDGSTKAPAQAKVWSSRIVFGSVAGTLTPGQTLWDTLLADGSVLRTTRGGSYAFDSPAGENQVFGVLHSIGAPTFKDPNGFTIPPSLVGNASVTENGTTQSFDFYTVGNAGSSTTYTMN